MHYIKLFKHEGGTAIYVCNAEGEVVYIADTMASAERKVNTLNGGLGLNATEYFAAQAMVGLGASGEYAQDAAGLAEDALSTGTYMVDLMNRRLKAIQEKKQREGLEPKP